MDEETFDLISTGIEAFNRRDLDAMLEALDPDIELVPLRAVLGGSAYRGHAGVRAYVDDMAQDWRDAVIEIDGMRDLGSGHVLVSARMRAHTPGSGAEVAATGSWLCQVHARRVRRIRFYRDADAAIEAARAEADVTESSPSRSSERDGSRSR